MDITTLKPERTEASYQAFYSEFAFQLLANPVPLYQNFLKHLGKFGANLSVLRADLTTLADSNINCYLQDISTFVACRIDRLDVTFPKLHELGVDILKQIVGAAWATVHNTDKSIVIARHVVTANVHTRIVGSKYDTIARSFVKMPTKQAHNMQAGAVFYISDNKSQGSISVDRMPGQSQALLLKLSVSFDAKQVSVEQVAKESEDYFTKHLRSLSLEIKRDHQR